MESASGLVFSADVDEPVGEIVAARDASMVGLTYAYDPSHTINVTIKGEEYKVTKEEYLLSTDI